MRKTLALNLSERDLVIANSNTSRYYSGSDATLCMTSKLFDFPYGDYDRVIIDIRIPTVNTQRFAHLVRLCTGRTVIITTLVYEADRQALSKVVERSLDAVVQEVKASAVEEFLVEAKPEPQNRWCLCTYCGTKNFSVNRTKDDPNGLVICVNCFRAFPANASKNWVE